MKRRYIFWIVILLIVISVGIFALYFESKLTKKGEFNYCEKDEDCVLVDYTINGDLTNSCCSGCLQIVNIEYSNQQEIWREENCKGPDSGYCPEVSCEYKFDMAKIEPVCKLRRCTINT